MRQMRAAGVESRRPSASRAATRKTCRPGASLRQVRGVEQPCHGRASSRQRKVEPGFVERNRNVAVCARVTPLGPAMMRVFGAAPGAGGGGGGGEPEPSVYMYAVPGSSGAWSVFGSGLIPVWTARSESSRAAVAARPSRSRDERARAPYRGLTP